MTAEIDERQMIVNLRNRYLDEIEEYVSRLRIAFEHESRDEYRLLTAELMKVVNEYNMFADKVYTID